MKKAWDYLLAEPFTWIFYAFFQPRLLERDFGRKGHWRRLILMLRMIVLIFLLAYPIGIIVHLLLISFHFVTYTDIANLLLDIALGITLGIVGSITLGITLGIVFGITLGIAFGITLGIAFGIFFIVCYFIGLFRLPFYLVSGPSALRAYLASRKNPSQVFTYLRRSSLHGDELVYLPLPYLKETLLIAYDQDSESALEEIAFIAAERPQQLRAARGALLDIAVRDLEERKKMSEIVEAAQFLDTLFPQETKLLDPQWTLPITRLREASRDAARFCSPLGRRAGLEALGDMVKHVKGVHPNVSVRNARLSDRLAQVVDAWLALAQQEQEKLEQLSDFIRGIDNPYNPGNALKPNDPLFFGRLDLVQVLEMELMKGERRTTFLMTGERRMGKSSTLLQLPLLLGSRFLPIFYDLQSPGIFASTPTFLGTLAEGIYKEMNARNMPVDRLVYRTLPRYGEGASITYSIFDEWLRNVELLLEREDWTLLLLLDEFEKLEEVGLKRAFDLPLLLDWFRNIIQYHPHIALLFSGVHTFSEMGEETHLNWSGYFVNVRTLRVSFLHKDEARRLITRPVSTFPGGDIYGDGVVERIIAETGCHPFLVQAVCSVLIDSLNAEKKERAELDDVTRAIDRTLENWDSYFRDLWIRTDEQQRACLIALRALTVADREHIQQQSGLDDIVVRHTLQALLKRDLVRQNEDDTYSISMPIFSAWVERRMYM